MFTSVMKAQDQTDIEMDRGERSTWWRMEFIENKHLYWPDIVLSTITSKTQIPDSARRKVEVVKQIVLIQTTHFINKLNSVLKKNI